MADSLKKLRTLLFNHKIPKDHVLAFIKTEMNAGEFAMAINSNPLLKKIKLSNSTFPAFDQIVQRNSIIFTRDLRREIYWLLYNIIEEASLIDEFLKQKKAFEILILLNKFELAESKLEEITHIFGASMWSLEMNLLLKEFQNGTKENWELLSEYLKKINSAFYQFVINSYSKRIEENMSFENFYNQFQIDINSIASDPYVRDFLVFKSVFNANYEYDYPNLEGVLYVSNILGTIDQYLSLIEALLRLIAANSNNDSLVITILKKLDNKILNDNRLVHLQNLLGLNKPTKLFENITEEILPIIDLYSCSDFEAAQTLALEKLTINPDIFELYEIYAKCTIHLKSNFISSNISPFVDEMLEAVYKVLLFNKESERYRNRLLKISLAFLSFDFGKQISSFALSISRDFYSNFHSFIGNLSSSINNPRLLVHDFHGRRKEGIFNNDKLLSSLSFNINLFICGDIELPIYNLVSNQVQADLYQAKSFFYKKDYLAVIQKLDKYISHLDIPFYYDNVLFLLFESYIKTGNLISALKLDASILADNEFFLYRLDVTELSNQISTEGFEGFAEFIDLPILFSIVAKDYDLYEPYIEFMLYNETEYPSQLNIDELIDKFSLNKVIYFLKVVCKISTIRYSLEFTSLEIAEQERIKICEILKVIDSSNAITYQEEVSELLRTDAVRKVIQEVDEGRLFVNIEGLKSQQLSTIKESFTRYKEIESISKEKGLIGFNSSKERGWINLNLNQKSSYSELDDPAFLAFKAIFLDSKERFLFSKEYGLDSSLSTRIRHGALKNHIRSVFEKLSLITSKSGNEYLDNIKWQEQLSYDYDLNLYVQQLLKAFSRNIDDYTTYIVEKLIQIQNERHLENQDGLFEYYTDDSVLWLIYSGYRESFDSVDSIVDIVYNDLIGYTIRTVCVHIYEYFINEINERYQQLIEDLQGQLRELRVLGISELMANVLKSSTDIQSELEVIAEWFTLTTTSSSSLLNLETIINASIELTNKINPNFCLSPQIINNCEPVIGYNAFIFVFNILLNNIIQHSKLEPHEVTVQIILDQQENFIVISFKNNLSINAGYEKNKERLEAVKNNWNNHTDIERSNKEGESGYDKIKRLLLYEAKAKTDKFDFYFENNSVMISLYFPYNKPNADEKSASN